MTTSVSYTPLATPKNPTTFTLFYIPFTPRRAAPPIFGAEQNTMINPKKRLLGLLAAAFLFLNTFAASAQTALPAAIQEKQSVYEALRQHLDQPIAEVIALYHELKREAPEGYTFENEQELNRLGCDLLAAERTQAAIVVFQLLVSEFPERANPYDSLGEAYQKAVMPHLLANIQSAY